MNKFTYVFIAKQEGTGWASPFLWGTSRKPTQVDRWELLPSGNARFFSSELKTPATPEAEDFLSTQDFFTIPEELK